MAVTACSGTAGVDGGCDGGERRIGSSESLGLGCFRVRGKGAGEASEGSRGEREVGRLGVLLFSGEQVARRPAMRHGASAIFQHSEEEEEERG